MKIIITGASGFVGTNLVKHLKKKSHHVTAICDYTCEAGDMADYAYYTGLIGLKNKDIRSWKADAIVHLAANNDTLSNNFDQMMRHNFTSSKNMFKIARKLRCSHFIYASSMAVYGNEINTEDPLNTYATSKLMFDNYMKSKLQNENIKIIGLRLCNVYGPHETNKGRRMSYLGQMLRNMILNKKIKLFEEIDVKRDWVYVDDVCEAISKGLNSNASGIFNIGSGNTISFIDLFNKLAAVTGYDKKPELIKNKHRDSYQSIESNDITPAKNSIGYNPKYDFDKGIEKYYSEIIKNYPAIS